MRRFKLITLFLVVWLVPSYGQDQHMEFMGIPIDGKIEDFKTQLTSKGFTQKVSKDNVIIMNGVFANEECDLYILATPISGIVWKIGVYLNNKYDSWIDIKFDYEKYKESYTKKYGEPFADYHFFAKPYYEGDGYEINAIKLNKCKYRSMFRAPGGSVDVAIQKFLQISFAYEDTINSELDSQENEEMIQSDI